MNYCKPLNFRAVMGAQYLHPLFSRVLTCPRK